MNKNAKLVAALAAAVVLSALVWSFFGRNPELPTAAAPRGQFATDQASEEAALPVTSKQ